MQDSDVTVKLSKAFQYFRMDAAQECGVAQYNVCLRCFWNWYYQECLESFRYYSLAAGQVFAAAQHWAAAMHLDLALRRLTAVV